MLIRYSKWIRTDCPDKKILWRIKCQSLSPSTIHIPKSSYLLRLVISKVVALLRKK